MKLLIKYLTALLVILTMSFALDSCALSKEDIHAKKVKNGLNYQKLKKKNLKQSRKMRRKCRNWRIKYGQ